MSGVVALNIPTEDHKKPRKVTWHWFWRDVEEILSDPQHAHLRTLSPELQAFHAIKTLDGLGFQKQITTVAGVGFFVDGYLLFANNFALPLLGYLYWNHDMSSDHETAINSLTLLGAIIGQVFLGVLADKYGRSNVYGWELGIIIVSSVVITMPSTGLLSNGSSSMRISPWLIFWRLIIGFGVGAEYPITAVLTSEFAPTQWRAHMLATVFMAQSLGQFLAALVTFAALAGNMPLDSIWRLLYGLAAVPAAFAVYLRFTIPESPRYTLDVHQNPNKANRAVEGLVSEPSKNKNTQEEGITKPEGNPKPRGNAQSKGSTPPEGTTQDAITQPEGSPGGEASGRYDKIKEPSEQKTLDPEGNPKNEQATSQTPEYHFPPMPGFDDFMFYFWNEGNWRNLALTSGTWFLLDLAFFGLGLSSPQIVTGVWKGCNSKISRTNSTNYEWNSEPGVTPSEPSTPINSTALGSTITFQQMFQDNESGFMVLVSIGAVIGSLLLMGLVRVMNRIHIMIIGFGSLFVLFSILGGIIVSKVNDNGDHSLNGVYITLNVLYAFCQLFFNLGPNGLTFMFPAEIFPTRYRCSCYGVSAAAGKFGSVIAQVIFFKVQFGALENCQGNPNRNLGIVLLVFGLVMLLGAFLALYLPRVQVRGAVSKNKSLELLARGRHPEIREQREAAERNGETIVRWKKTHLLPPYDFKRPPFHFEIRGAAGQESHDTAETSEDQMQQFPGSSGTAPQNTVPYAGT